MSIPRAILSSKLALVSIALALLAGLGFLGVGRQPGPDRGVVAPDPAASKVPPSVGLDGDGVSSGGWQASPSATAVPADATIPETEISNATRGAVSDATARDWARAYLGAVRGSVLAVERQDDALLRQLYIGPPDGDTLRLIFNTRAAGGRLSYAAGHEPHVTRLVLVTLSPEQRTAIAAEVGPIAGPYAWVVTYQGPIDLSVGWPGAATETYAVLPAQRRITELSAGGVVDVAPLGSVWREAFSRDCTAHPDATLCPY
jgi:hypothetical protein